MGQERNRERLTDLVNGGTGKRCSGIMNYDLGPYGMDYLIISAEYLSEDELKAEADKLFEKHLKSGIYLYCTLRKCMTPDEYIKHETEAREKIRQEHFEIESSDIPDVEKNLRHANIGHHWFRDERY